LILWDILIRGEQHHEYAAFAQPALNPDLSVVCGDYELGHREPDTYAANACVPGGGAAHEFLEDFPLFPHRYPHAPVAYPKDNVCVLASD